MEKIVKITRGDPRSDEEIIRKCLDGDSEVYRVLVERYQDRIFNLVLRFVGSHHWAEDIAQEAFIKAFESLDDFRKESRFSTWLYRIAVNRCKDFLKDRRRSEVSLEAIYSPSSSEYSSPVEDPENGLLRRERALIIEDVILTLPVKYREVFLLRHLEGFSYREIGDVLGLPINTLKMRVFRARDLLKNRLRKRK